VKNLPEDKTTKVTAPIAAAKTTKVVIIFLVCAFICAIYKIYQIFE
jgi:hypothetical protein